MLSRTSVRLLVGLGLLLPSYALCAPQNDGTIAAPLEIQERVLAAHLLSNPAAKEPDGFLKRCSNAMVMLKITVDESGKVIDAEVTSGYDELKGPSLSAVRQWTYSPYQQNGHAVPVSSRVSLFYLGDGESFPMYSPDGKGGVKGGNMLPLPPGCGVGPTIVREP
jgi:TonB family protein